MKKKTKKGVNAELMARAIRLADEFPELSAAEVLALLDGSCREALFRNVARQVAADLFSDGKGGKANRLVLELGEKIPGSGWSEVALEDRIVERLMNFCPRQEAATATLEKKAR